MLSGTDLDLIDDVGGNRSDFLQQSNVRVHFQEFSTRILSAGNVPANYACRHLTANLSAGVNISKSLPGESDSPLSPD